MFPRNQKYSHSISALYLEVQMEFIREKTKLENLMTQSLI